MSDSRFSDLVLAEPILRALSSRKHFIPTPIQAQAIPELLAGRDMLGIAQTGTGKTGAFALPILHQLSRKRVNKGSRRPRALSRAPTRELAGAPRDSMARGDAPSGAASQVTFSTKGP